MHTANLVKYMVHTCTIHTACLVQYALHTLYNQVLLVGCPNWIEWDLARGGSMAVAVGVRDM